MNSLLRCAAVPFPWSSCAPKPHLTSEVIGLPSTVKAGKTVRFEVRVTNRGRADDFIMPPGLVTMTTKLKFFPGALSPGDRAGRSSIDYCPPIGTHLQPGQTLSCPLTWKPPVKTRGSGYLYIGLPDALGEIPAVPPQPVTVKAPGRIR